MAALAEIIRSRRLAAGLTQAALADALGVAYQQVQRWEHGRRRPSGRMAVALARVLGGRVEDYLT